MDLIDPADHEISIHDHGTTVTQAATHGIGCATANRQRPLVVYITIDTGIVEIKGIIIDNIDIHRAVLQVKIPIHLQAAYQWCNQGPGSFPVAERCASEILSLPIYPELTDAQVRQVAQHVTDWHT